MAAIPKRKFSSSEELRQYIKAECGPRILLAFSGGKDAIAAWLALRADGFEVLPYHMTVIPGLAFVEAGLARYEQIFGTKIVRVPHPSFFRWLRNLVFQPPERCRLIEEARIPPLDYPDLVELAKHRLGCPGERLLAASGVRAADSPLRRQACDRHGAINWRAMQCWPIFDWRIADVESALRGAGISLGREYLLFGRSFDGLDYRFLRPTREHYPEDYQRILRWFPLADLELFRRGDLPQGGKNVAQ